MRIWWRVGKELKQIFGSGTKSMKMIKVFSPFELMYCLENFFIGDSGVQPGSSYWSYRVIAGVVGDFY